MDTQSLRLFVLASEVLNISAAGRKLGMAPAVASAKLAKLEHQIGSDLLHRTTRKVALSSEGEDFLPFAREILQQEEAALAALGKGDVKVSGTLRFAAPSTFAQQYIVPALPAFLAANPGLTLDLRLSDTQFDLIEGSFDLALRNSVPEDSSLKGRILADDRRILCAAPAYVAAHGTPETPEELCAHSLIAFQDPRPRPLTGPRGQTGSFDPERAKTRLIIDDGLSQKLATIAGAGISLNARWSVHTELKEGRLVQVLPDFNGAVQTRLWLVYPKSTVVSPKVRVFMDFLIQLIGRDPPWSKFDLDQ